MNMLWFFPVSLLVAFAGTRTTLRELHVHGARKESGWWLLLVVAWFPVFCWIMSQFVHQY